MVADVIMDTTEGQGMDRAYDFEDYKLKVNRYIEKTVLLELEPGKKGTKEIWLNNAASLSERIAAL